MADRVATQDAGARPPTPRMDISEKGRTRGGETLSLDRRLYMQLLVYTGCRKTETLSTALQAAGVHGVLYEDLNDPLGVGLLTFDESPSYFLDTVHPLLRAAPFADLEPIPSFTMFGRTYSMGWESDLVEALITRPRGKVLSPDLAWAVWYPLRRRGSFETLDEKEQHAILSEHGSVGQAFGKSGLAHDIRLSCHGLSRDDNDFVIGVLSPDLHPISAVVQRMRKTRQTSTYLERLGPFFVGRALWRGTT
jgi:hypothetical protein